MKNVTAILSLLHEPAGALHAGLRRFRAKPVIWWTMQRLAQCEKLEHTAILCWQDQMETIAPLAQDRGAYALVKDPRIFLPQVEAIAAAQRWADGWRGGLMSSCNFDRGFYAPWMLEIAHNLKSEAVIAIDPSSGLVDAQLIDQLIEHATKNPTQELCFSQAAPGLSGALVRVPMLQRLATTRLHAGKFLHYTPDNPTRDPIATEACAQIPTTLARTSNRFTIDSNRQIDLIDRATVHLNGQLMSTASEMLLHSVQTIAAPNDFPREIVLEINTSRATRPLWWAGRHLQIKRPDFSAEHAVKLFAQIGRMDDLRLTLAGIGDPLLCGSFFQILDIARLHDISSIHVETDLIGVSHDQIRKLVESEVDVVSVHIPATSQTTYAGVMGADALSELIGNINVLLEHRQKRTRGIPLIVPVFTKVKANLHEMEAWYDHWIRLFGHAVIVSPADCAGQVPDFALADMAPPKRRACRRIESKMTILCDGKVVSCEQDVLGKQVMGDIATMTLAEIWRSQFGDLRSDHSKGCLSNRSLCSACKEWHRP